MRPITIASAIALTFCAMAPAGGSLAQTPAEQPPILAQATPPMPGFPQQASQPSQWLYFVSYNDTDALGEWVTKYCGTRDPSGVSAFIAQQGDGMAYAVHLWCRADKADVNWVRDGEHWDGGSVEAVSNALASGKAGLVGFIRNPYGDSVVWLKQTK